MDRFVIDRFAAAVGGMGYVTLRTYTNPKWRPIFVWCQGGRLKVQKVYDQLRPWLSPVKIKQFETALAEANKYAKEK